jgi:uncharacterized protein
MIGVIGDTHDNLMAIAKAVEFFNLNEMDLVVHTGDIVSPFAIEAFKDLKCEIKFVYGNNEGDRTNLVKKIREELNAEISDYLEFEYNEKAIMVYHGQNPSLLDSIVKSNKYDIVLTGHTHTPEITIEENTIIINPGEACGYMNGVMTVAVLDTDRMQADIHKLE